MITQSRYDAELGPVDAKQSTRARRFRVKTLVLICVQHSWRSTSLPPYGKRSEIRSAGRRETARSALEFLIVLVVGFVDTKQVTVGVFGGILRGLEIHQMFLLELYVSDE